MKSLRTVSTTLVAVLLLAACASTEKRFDKAQTLEAEGRFAEAADYYVKVLEREPDYADARARLQDVGQRAVELFFDEADAALDRADASAAFAVLRRLDALRAHAAGVGVALAVPADYADFRLDVADAAIEQQITLGEAAEQRGQWRQALDAYERAAGYTDDRATIEPLRERQAEVYLRWAEEDADDARYRVAYDRAQQGLDLLGAGHPLARQIAALQDDALGAGVRYVAVLPFWRTEAVARTASDGFLDDLNDVLLFERWAQPYPFVAVADPVQVRRELRRLRYDRTVITREQAVEIGRIAEADFVIVGEVTGFERSERGLRERTRRAPLKGRPSTTTGGEEAEWIEQRLTVELDAEVAFRILDVHTRRVVHSSKERVDVSAPLRRGVYAGDYRTLDLDGDALYLFEDAEADVVRDLENQLADALAERLSDPLYARLRTEIP